MNFVNSFFQIITGKDTSGKVAHITEQVKRVGE